MSQPLQTRTDESLALAARQGDMEAFEQLVDRFQPRLHRFLCQFTRDAEDARELTQDTFVRAYGGLNAYDAARPFAPWLFTIARRLATDNARRAAASLAGHSASQQLATVELPDPAGHLERLDAAQAVWDRARATLKPAQFQALWLRYVEDLTVAEVATVMGLTRVHVKVLLFRGRKALADAKERIREPINGIKRADAGPLLGRRALGESS